MNRYRTPQKIGTVVEALLARHGYLAVCREHEVIRRWPEIAGAAIARVSVCTAVENGTARVRVCSAAWRQELSYMKTALLANIRGISESVTDIVFY